MVHVVTRPRRCTKGEERYWDVTRGAAAGDALEQAELVDRTPYPTVGHRRREAVRDECAGGDAVRPGDREVRTERTFLARPAGVEEVILRLAGEIAEGFRAGGDPDPKRSWTSSRRE